MDKFRTVTELTLDEKIESSIKAARLLEMPDPHEGLRLLEVSQVKAEAIADRYFNRLTWKQVQKRHPHIGVASVKRAWYETAKWPQRFELILWIVRPMEMSALKLEQKFALYLLDGIEKKDPVAIKMYAEMTGRAKGGAGVSMSFNQQINLPAGGGQEGEARRTFAQRIAEARKPLALEATVVEAEEVVDPDEGVELP